MYINRYVGETEREKGGRPRPREWLGSVEVDGQMWEGNARKGREAGGGCCEMECAIINITGAREN